MTTTTYARATTFVDQRDDGSTFAKYTIGKDYPVCDDPAWYAGSDFTIIDDEGDAVPCWWDGRDPDVIWERVER